MEKRIMTTNQNHRVSPEIVSKVLSAIAPGLVCGMGKPEPGKMCVEAAVCYAYGLPHSDNPPCVDSVVRKFKIYLNDSRWSDELARAAGMKRIAIAQLGSAGAIDSNCGHRYDLYLLLGQNSLGEVGGWWRTTVEPKDVLWKLGTHLKPAELDESWEKGVPPNAGQTRRY